MDEYIQKYLDGDLSDEEALTFSRALDQDPKLEAELRSLEHMLVLAAEDVKREPSAGFTDGVMDRIVHRGAPSRHAEPARLVGGLRAWFPRLAWAAAFAAVFMIGYLAARQNALLPGKPAPVETASTGETESLRIVRLVYVPQDPGVSGVSVAGTFNAWNPESTTMIKRDGVWVVQMVLPADTYEYMFVEDGQRWVTDPLAMQTRDDGFGRKNAVLDLSL